MLLRDAASASTGPTWLDIVTAAAAILALGLSAFTLWRTRRVDRRNVFIEIHRLLLDPDLVAARRRLYKIKSDEDVALLDDEQDESLTHIYRVLALFDLLGYYAESRWVNREEVLEEWSDSLHRSRAPGRHVLAWRRRVTEGPLWPHYQALAIATSAHVEERKRKGPPSDPL